MSSEERENTEEERVETAKEIISDYRPAGNTEEILSENKSESKLDQYGKRRRNIESNRKANPSS